MEVGCFHWLGWLCARRSFPAHRTVLVSAFVGMVLLIPAIYIPGKLVGLTRTAQTARMKKVM